MSRTSPGVARGASSRPATACAPRPRGSRTGPASSCSATGRSGCGPPTRGGGRRSRSPAARSWTTPCRASRSTSPGSRPAPRSSSPRRAAESPRPSRETLVVLDATWAQARRMLQRIPELQTLPRVSLPGGLAERLRQPTVKGGMSTIEALAAALDLLGDVAAARALDPTWRLAVERGLSLRWSSAGPAGTPGPGTRPRDVRPTSAAAWLPGPHLGTVYASVARPFPRPRFRRERWDLPDGDFVDVDRLDGAAAGAPRSSSSRHGLEGNSRASYVRGLAAAAARRGSRWRPGTSAAAPGSRTGCSGSTTPATPATSRRSWTGSSAEDPGRPIAAGRLLAGRQPAREVARRARRRPARRRARGGGHLRPLRPRRLRHGARRPGVLALGLPGALPPPPAPQGAPQGRRPPGPDRRRRAVRPPRPSPPTTAW